MTDYYVDDGGSNTSPFDTWAKAATSLSALDDAVALASGDIVYVGHDHVCQFTHSANRTITGPTADPPCIIISATSGSSPVAYAASTTNQVDTTEGAYSTVMSGSFAVHGVRFKSGSLINILGTSQASPMLVSCTFAPAANSYVQANANGAFVELVNCTVDLTADGTTNRSGTVFQNIAAGLTTIKGLSFVNAAYRTGSIFDGSTATYGLMRVDGADFSGFTNGTVCELVNGAIPSVTRHEISNCLTAATWAPSTGNPRSTGSIFMTNVGPADAPTYLFMQNRFGTCLSTDSIYRSGGASIEGTSTSWLVTTTAFCSENSAFYLPYIYGTVASTGSKTFDVYITNDTADFTDAEVWLEVDYLGTADEAQISMAGDHRVITATAANQTDDTASTWTGTGPNFTYKQKLSVTATVNETGMYRARVCVGPASIASSRYFYVDPKVTVS